jgi:hypothetical protein
LDSFIRGEDQSIAAAAKLEVAPGETFDEAQPFADLSLGLASCRPGGGPYLYDENDIVRMMRPVAQQVRTLLQGRAGP